MSLEQQVTALVEASNNLTSAVNNKIGQIDKKMGELEVTAKDAVFTEMVKTLTVNENTGNDSNSGTSSSPLKSIGQAVSRIPNGGTLIVDVRSDITDLWGAESRSERDQVCVQVDGGKTVIVQLNNFTFFVKTALLNTGVTDYLMIQQKVYCSVGSSFTLNNGTLDIDYYGSGHIDVSPFYHPNYRAIIRTENNYSKIENLTINGAVATMAMFSIDGWSGTRSDVIMNYVTFNGVGMLRMAGNGAVTIDDIHIAKRSSTIDVGWTNQ